MSSTDTPGGRHRLAVAAPRPPDHGRRAAHPARAAQRPSLAPRSATVVAATVGAVFALGLDQQLPAPRPHPDAPGHADPTRDVAGPALQPVVPAQDDGPSARLAALPGGVSGRAIAGMHPADGSVRAAAAFRAERVVDAVPAFVPVQP